MNGASLPFGYCWSSPMERLMFHLSPVTRRRSLKASFQSRRTRSEPDKKRCVASSTGLMNDLNNLNSKISLANDMLSIYVASLRKVIFFFWLSQSEEKLGFM